ncbi:ABC transporter substrate-binding protein [Nonomuraea sp. NPDC059194]|uniref:ABC transporter substrate-binding protein n=1 Tax=Nonomuraea sp. NPDC059194 TaxID=3346764 RepID=UPI0036C98229
MHHRRALTALLALSLAGSLAACSSGGKTGATESRPGATSAGAQKPMVIDVGFSGTTITRNFNPFNIQATQGMNGYIYENLFTFNILKGGAFVPWLATKYEWSDDGKKITIHLDPRATWSDGSKLTSKDVVFTMTYAKEHKNTTNAGFQWESVDAPDDKTVEITFAQPSFTLVDQIGRIRPVQEKTFQGKDPNEFTNPDPVGTGPYKLAQFSPQQLTFEAREDYWKQEVPVKTLKMPIIGGTGVLSRLLSGEVAWSGGSVPNVMKSYVGKDPEHNHAWYPTYGSLFLWLNTEKKPFDNVHVRKAISLALDRQQIADAGNPGLFHPINLTGLDQETMADWIAPQYANAVHKGADLEAAKAELAKAGVKPEDISFDLIENAEWTDAVQRDKIIAQQLGKLGIKVNVRLLPGAQTTTMRQQGDFEAATGGAVYNGQTPYSFYNSILSSKKIGTEYNWGRISDKNVDGLLEKMASTGDTEEIKGYVHELEKFMVEQSPLIPLANIGASTEYSTKDWTGWPDASNPYTISAPWSGPPDNIYTLLSLKPAAN